MPESDITADAGEQDQTTTETPAETPNESFKAPASQEELDRIITKRIERERAKFADYDDVKSRAEKAAELEAANKDLADKIAGFEARDARTALVSKVATSAGVDASLLAEMRGDSEEELTAQAARLSTISKPSVPVVSGAGKAPGVIPADPAREAVRALFKRD